jgi:hypothetical protein
MCIRIAIDYITFYIITVFPADLVHLKKPSVARRAYRSPMPWGYLLKSLYNLFRTPMARGVSFSPKCV